MKHLTEGAVLTMQCTRMPEGPCPRLCTQHMRCDALHTSLLAQQVYNGRQTLTWHCHDCKVKPCWSQFTKSSMYKTTLSMACNRPAVQ